MSQFLHEFWPHLTGALVLVVELSAAGHAVLFKRDSRATIGWVGLIFLTPLLGALLYWIFGINRIHRRATLLRTGQPETEPAALGACRFGKKDRGKVGERRPPFFPPGALDAAFDQPAAVGRESRLCRCATGTRPTRRCWRPSSRRRFRSAWPRTFSTTTRRGRCLPKRWCGAPAGRGSARADRRHRIALHAADDCERAERSRGADRDVHALADAGVRGLFQFAKPPENFGGRWKDRFHRRDEHSGRDAGSNSIARDRQRTFTFD